MSFDRQTVTHGFMTINYLGSKKSKKSSYSLPDIYLLMQALLGALDHAWQKT